MPTYEYRCEACDRTFDVVQSFHDDPLTSCPTCGSPVRKVFGNVGIVFKGSGFYKTDSRNGGPSKGKESSRETADSSSGSQADKSAGDKGGSESTLLVVRWITEQASNSFSCQGTGVEFEFEPE